MIPADGAAASVSVRRRAGAAEAPTMKRTKKRRCSLLRCCCGVRANGAPLCRRHPPQASERPLHCRTRRRQSQAPRADRPRHQRGPPRCRRREFVERQIRRYATGAARGGQIRHRAHRHRPSRAVAMQPQQAQQQHRRRKLRRGIGRCLLAWGAKRAEGRPLLDPRSG